MKTHLKLLALFLMLIMLVQSTVISTFAVVHIDVDDTSVILNATGTGYTKTEDVKYNKSGNYVYNWGVREEEATFLSPMAVAFYTGNYVYDVVSELSGATAESNVPSSSIYKTLHNLMEGKQTSQTSYEATKNLFQYTDCQLGGGKISSFYSGISIGPSWSTGGWNREHCWPNSKGDKSGNGENDIMMLRPTSTSENSSRGNKAYGRTTSGSYYNPNDESQKYGKNYDLRGDVARIVLYTYVRCECTYTYNSTTNKYSKTSIFGVDGVIESISVLLEWIEADPVDTWELGRNDAVQSITGTRNVFVDYPEYAFILFGKEIPSDMVTPSGEAQANGHHWNSGEITVQATCTTTGVKTYKCTDSGCNETKTETIKALGHSMGAATVTKEADCLNKGEKVASCTRSGCTYKTTTTINALGHAWGNWIIDKEATETELGAKHHVCSRCQTEETGTIPLLGHECTYTTVVTLPTCTERGYTTYTCTGVGCGNVEVKDYVDMIPHNYEYGVCTVCTAQDPNAPTYTADDLRSIVTRLVSGTYSGKEYYNKICEAIAIYNSFSPAKKEEVSGLYRTLTTIIAQYNNEVASVNEDADALGFTLPSTTVVSAEVLCFAVYSLLNKKYI